ncbi:hypothetical protein [Streptomyces sp. NPDC058418]|uniref:hypothetical protein n=1 Tax=Streptomyces sp. NPDC058418 TaxID=3346488 RepID=UPI003649358A
MTDRRQVIREPGVESGPAQPRGADTPAQFVAVMRQLRQWAHLSYRELEKRAEAVGEVLPRATLAGVLNRQELPREELLAAAVTGVTLLPDDGTGEPHITPTGEPAVTTTPSETSGPAPDRAPPAEAVPDDKPARSKAPHTTPSTSTAPAKVTPSPAPERTTAEPSWPEQGQGPTAYEPPPQPSTSSPAQSQDPFPEETCWDVTDGCV